MDFKIRNYQLQLLKQFELNQSVTLKFDSCIIEVNTNSKELILKLKNYFKQFVTTPTAAVDMRIEAYEGAVSGLDLDYTVKQPDPGKTKIKEAWCDVKDGRVIKKVITGMHFLFGKEFNIAIGPCLENDNQVVNFINNRFIEWELDKGAMLGHAAAVKHNKKGLALAGFSGMGKSTLALHIMSRGVTFVSNDRLMTKANGKISMMGVPKMPRVNPGTLLNNPDLETVLSREEKEKFSALPIDELWALEHKYDVFVDDCFGEGSFELESEMSALGILNWERNGEPLEIKEVNLDERRDLLDAYMKSPGLFYVSDTIEEKKDPENYLKHLKKVKVFELSGGVDFDKAADFFMDFFNQ